MENKYLTP